MDVWMAGCKIWAISNKVHHLLHGATFPTTRNVSKVSVFSGPSVSNQSCERLWVGQKRPSGKMTAAVTYWTFNGPNGRLVVMNLSCLSPPRLTEDRPAEWNTAEDSDSPLQKTTDETSFTRSSVSAGFWTRGKIVGVRLSFKTQREERERDREEEEKKL